MKPKLTRFPSEAQSMSASKLESLIAHLKESLERRPILDELERKVSDGSSSAGTRREEVFTRDFLCPEIARFCRSISTELNLPEGEVCKGLGTEGFKNCLGFGFTPARKLPHLFTKSDVIDPSPPPGWFRSNKTHLPTFQACPDFAITQPLPFSLVGETKFIRNRVSPKAALRELYNATRQAVFYLGAFRRYESALVVIADASPGHSFVNGVDQEAHPELLRRFGADCDIYLSTIRIR